MEFDNVEGMKSIVAMGLVLQLSPAPFLGSGHIAATNMLVRPLTRSVSRPVGLVRLLGKRDTDGMELVRGVAVFGAPGGARLGAPRRSQLGSLLHFMLKSGAIVTRKTLH
jgi:hypothetical protein